MLLRIASLSFLIFAVGGCGEEDSDDASEQASLSYSCAVTQDFAPDDATQGDLSYCFEWENVSQEVVDQGKELCTSASGTGTDGTLCTVTSGREGCTITSGGYTFTTWLTGANWEAGSNTSNTICDGGTPVTKE